LFGDISQLNNAMSKHRAACQCGSLTVKADVNPDFVILCNCKACQLRTGAPFGVGAYFKIADLSIKGDTNTWARSAQSGRELTNHFCPECGTTLYWTLEMRPEHMGVAIGSFEGPMPEPLRAIWAEQKLDWVSFPDHWPVFDKATPE
jgi:hypothetical protein